MACHLRSPWTDRRRANLLRARRGSHGRRSIRNVAELGLSHAPDSTLHGALGGQPLSIRCHVSYLFGSASRSARYHLGTSEETDPFPTPRNRVSELVFLHLAARGARITHRRGSA